MFLFLLLFSLTFEEEKIIKFLENYMVQTESKIKLEKKYSGENFSLYYARRESEIKGREELVPCALFGGKNIILGEYFALTKEEKSNITPQFLSSFLTKVMGTNVKAELEREIDKNLSLYKIFEETGYGKVQREAYILAKRHLFLGNMYDINDKIDEIRMKIIDLNYGGSIGNKEAKDRLFFFFDLECPYCEKIEREISPILKGKKDIFASFFLFPLTIHPLSFKASAGAFCFKNIKEELFFDYINWFYSVHDSIELENIDEQIYNFAKEKEMEKEFLDCYMKKENIDMVLKSLQQGMDLGVHYTPTIFYNGKNYPASAIIKMIKEKE